MFVKIVEHVYFNGVRGMVFNATFNNISVIFWRSVLSMEETGVPRETKPLHGFVTPYVMVFLVFNDLR
jgi:hypothetical protein